MIQVTLTCDRCGESVTRNVNTHIRYKHFNRSIIDYVDWFRGWSTEKCLDELLTLCPKCVDARDELLGPLYEAQGKASTDLRNTRQDFYGEFARCHEVYYDAFGRQQVIDVAKR